MIHIQLPDTCSQIYEELTNIPFYRTSEGYAFARYLLYDDEVKTVTATFLEDSEASLLDFETDEDGVARIRGCIQTALDQLSDLLISEEAFSTWITFQKEIEGIKTYHLLLETLYEDLMVIYAERDITQQMTVTISDEKKPTTVTYQGGYPIQLKDRDDLWRRGEANGEEDTVLNQHNPFADISIREQTFIYGSSQNQFETLGLTTSHTLTKLAKDSETSYMALQPGFKIRKFKLADTRKKQDIMFDDTLTTEIAQKDENVYVYID